MKSPNLRKLKIHKDYLKENNPDLPNELIMLRRKVSYLQLLMFYFLEKRNYFLENLNRSNKRSWQKKVKNKRLLVIDNRKMVS